MSVRRSAAVSNFGFDETIPAPAGKVTVCVAAINVGPGENSVDSVGHHVTVHRDQVTAPRPASRRNRRGARWSTTATTHPGRPRRSTATTSRRSTRRVWSPSAAGPRERARAGVYARAATTAASPLQTVAAVGGAVPAPNNLDGDFTEFPSIPRIDDTGNMIATRGQSVPVWSYTPDGGVETKVGTSGIYATVNGTLTTGASLLGAVPGFEQFSVPGITPAGRFDQFPGAPAVDGTTIVFKGNYTDGDAGETGVFFRDAAVAASADAAHRQLRHPDPQPARRGRPTRHGRVRLHGATERRGRHGGLHRSGHRGGTDPGWRLPGTHRRGPGARATGRASAIRCRAWHRPTCSPRSVRASRSTAGSSPSGVHGARPSRSRSSAPRTATRTCSPTATTTYPDGYVADAPVHQGIFIHDTVTDTTSAVATSDSLDAEAQFDTFQYWTFSGKPPTDGTGGDEGGDESQELPRWRSSAFAAVSGSGVGVQGGLQGDRTERDHRDPSRPGSDVADDHHGGGHHHGGFRRRHRGARGHLRHLCRHRT